MMVIGKTRPKSADVFAGLQIPAELGYSSYRPSGLLFSTVGMKHVFYFSLQFLLQFLWGYNGNNPRNARRASFSIIVKIVYQNFYWNKSQFSGMTFHENYSMNFSDYFISWDKNWRKKLIAIQQCCIKRKEMNVNGIAAAFEEVRVLRYDAA